MNYHLLSSSQFCLCCKIKGIVCWLHYCIIHVANVILYVVINSSANNERYWMLCYNESRHEIASSTVLIRLHIHSQNLICWDRDVTAPVISHRYGENVLVRRFVLLTILPHQQWRLSYLISTTAIAMMKFHSLNAWYGLVKLLCNLPIQI